MRVLILIIVISGLVGQLLKFWIGLKACRCRASGPWPRLQHVGHGYTEISLGPALMRVLIFKIIIS